jgi:hypothetical protein
MSANRNGATAETTFDRRRPPASARTSQREIVVELAESLDLGGTRWRGFPVRSYRDGSDAVTYCVDKRKPIVVTNAVPSKRPSHGLRTRAVLVDGEWIIRTPLGVDADHCRRPAED